MPIDPFKRRKQRRERGEKRKDRERIDAVFSHFYAADYRFHGRFELLFWSGKFKLVHIYAVHCGRVKIRIYRDGIDCRQTNICGKFGAHGFFKSVEGAFVALYSE